MAFFFFELVFIMFFFYSVTVFIYVCLPTLHINRNKAFSTLLSIGSAICYQFCFLCTLLQNTFKTMPYISRPCFVINIKQKFCTLQDISHINRILVAYSLHLFCKFELRFFCYWFHALLRIFPVDVKEFSLVLNLNGRMQVFRIIMNTSKNKVWYMCPCRYE